MIKVQVLMSTYNGDKYLREQIDSILKQKNVEVRILVRDDGSNDKTKKILEEYKQRGALEWYSGKNLKPALSFMNLIQNAPVSDYYAFCDQDDVWDEDKLEVAVNKLRKYKSKIPALYFSKTRLVDSNLKIIDNKNKKRVQPRLTLGSALLINPVTGCTEVFNEALCNVLKMYNNTNVYMHDAWSYRLCIAIGGNVIFDDTAHISYRQHENNVVGGTSNIYKKYKRRIKNVITERKRIRECDARELLTGYWDMIPVENRKLIEKVAYYRKGIIKKIDLIRDKEIKTNNFEHNFAFICAVLLNSL